MKNSILLISCIVSIILLAPKNAHAQCGCNQPDPFGYNSSSCGLPTLNISGSIGTCQTSSCNASTATQYDIYLPPNVITGYAYTVHGGIVASEVITKGNGNVNRTPCASSGQYGSVNYLNHVTLKINWTTISTGNCLLIWAYTGISNGYPATLSYFTSVTVGTNTPPAAPTGISISSPSSYPICGWKVASSYVSNATSYVWSGYASGTYSDITGPTLPENQTAYECVKASNACASSSNYCTYVTLPNNSSCGSFRKQGTGIASSATAGTINVMTIIPNPATKYFIVETKNSMIRSVSVYSLYGVAVKQVNTTCMQTKIDVSGLARGMYLVKVITQGGSVMTEKLLLQ